MAPILNPAPLWQPDRSDYVILWHGCTAADRLHIERGIDLSCCAVNTDFGRGFYTTTLERQARQWAWDRFYDWKAKNPTATGNQPVVLQFRVRRYGKAPRRSALDDGFDALTSLAFVLGDFNSEDYWSLVQHCRQSVPGMAPVVHHHRRPGTDWYDLVSGRVAAFWRQRVAMDNADQISFHTDNGIALLDALILEGLRRNPINGHSDSYTWSVVV